MHSLSQDRGAALSSPDKKLHSSESILTNIKAREQIEYLRRLHPRVLDYR